MDVDAFGQRKKARSREPEDTAPPTPTLADHAAATRDASPLPLPPLLERTMTEPALREVTAGVNKVDLGAEAEVAPEKTKVGEETSKAEEEATPIEETTPAEGEAAKPTTQELVIAPASDEVAAAPVAAEEPAKHVKADDAAPDVSDSEASTAVAPDAAAPVSSKHVATAIDDADDDDTTAPIASSVSPEPIPAVTASAQ
jgi:hypothetical protein